MTIIFKSRIEFKDLPAITSDLKVGDGYLIKDSFKTNSDFASAPNTKCGSGMAVVFNGEKWEILDDKKKEFIREIILNGNDLKYEKHGEYNFVVTVPFPFTIEDDIIDVVVLSGLHNAKVSAESFDGEIRLYFVTAFSTADNVRVRVEAEFRV